MSAKASECSRVILPRLVSCDTSHSVFCGAVGRVRGLHPISPPSVSYDTTYTGLCCKIEVEEFKGKAPRWERERRSRP